MTTRLFALLLLISPALQAQTTWKGLKFGMNRTEVAKTIPDYKLVSISDTQMLSNVDFILNPPGMNANYPFTVRTNFNTQDRLDIVILTLDTLEMVSRKSIGDENGAVAITVFGLDSTLVGKYGAPAKVEGNCEEP